MPDALMDATRGPEFWTMVVVWLAAVSYACFLIVSDR